MKLAGIFNELSNDLDTQVDLMNEENVKFLAVNSLNGVDFSLYEKENYKKEIVPILKQGAEIICFETKIGLSFLDNDFEMELNDFERIIALADYTKVKRISIYGYYKGKDEHNNRIGEVNERIKQFCEIAKKQNIMIILRNHYLTYMNKANMMMDIIKEINLPNLKIGFDPVMFTRQNEIILPAYRLLRDSLEIVYLNDLDEFDVDTLVGLGRAKIFDLLRVMSKDNYKDFLVIDSNLKEYLNRKKLYKKSKIPVYNFIVISSKKYKSFKATDRKINKTAKEEVSPKYLAQLQIRFVKKMLSRMS